MNHEDWCFKLHSRSRDAKVTIVQVQLSYKREVIRCCVDIERGGDSNSTYILHRWISLGVVSLSCVVANCEDWCFKLHGQSRDAKVTSVQS